MIDTNRISFQYYLIYIVFAVVFLVLSGCSVAGRQVPEDKRLPLANGQTFQGSFTEGVLGVDYSYTVAGDTLKIAGDVYGRKSINSLKVQLVFIDQAGAVMESKMVYYSGYRSYYRGKINRNFSREYKIPAGAKDLSFDFFVEYRVSR